MFENLNQPYIFNNNFKHSIKTILLVTMAYMLIVLYFQPFGINFMNSSGDGYFVLGSGIFTALTFFVNTQVLSGIFPKTFNPEQWTIKKEIIQNICMFVFLSSSFGFLAYIFKVAYFDYSMSYFLTCALALLPIGLFNLSNYNNSLKMNMVKVFDSGKHWLAEEKKHFESGKLKQEGEVESGPLVVFTSENGKDKLTYKISDLVLLRSSGNYVEIFYKEGKLLSKSLIRQTLSKLEESLTEYPQFIRSHRCYLANFNHLDKFLANSGNYSLYFKGLEFEVPVSRSKLTQIKKQVTV